MKTIILIFIILTAPALAKEDKKESRPTKQTTHKKLEWVEPKNHPLYELRMHEEYKRRLREERNRERRKGA